MSGLFFLRLRTICSALLVVLLAVLYMAPAAASVPAGAASPDVAVNEAGENAAGENAAGENDAVASGAESVEPSTDVVTSEAPDALRTIPTSDVASAASEHRVVTKPPKPSTALYFRDIGAAISSALIEWLARVFGGNLQTWGTFLVWVSYALLTICLGFIVFLLARLLLQRFQESRPEAAPPTFLEISESEEPETVDHEAKLRAALDAGRVDEALAALWWCLASRILRGAADPAWTGRELVLRAERSDLLPWVRRMDRMIYGPEDAEIDAVREFWQELRAVAEARS